MISISRQTLLFSHLKNILLLILLLPLATTVLFLCSPLYSKLCKRVVLYSLSLIYFFSPIFSSALFNELFVFRTPLTLLLSHLLILHSWPLLSTQREGILSWFSSPAQILPSFLPSFSPGSSSSSPWTLRLESGPGLRAWSSSPLHTKWAY